MKILEAHAGVLTNFEVLDLLRSRGATTDALGPLGAITPSECKVFEYLVNTAACNQSREVIEEFWKRSDTFDLAEAEKLSIINTRPSTGAEIFPIIEKCEERLEDRLDDLVNLVVEILPPAKTEAEADEKETEMDDKQGEDTMQS